MIYDELRHYLNTAAGADTAGVIDRAWSAMLDWGTEDLMAIYEKCLFDDPNANDQEVVDAMVLQTHLMLDFALLQNGLVCAESVLLSQKVELLQTLYQIVSYEDQDEILQALDSDESDPEVAARILAILMPYDEGNLMAMFEDVDAKFRDGIRLRLVVAGDEAEARPDVKRQADAFVVFKATLAEDDLPLWAERFYRQPLAIGLPYKSYLNLYTGSRQDEGKTPEQIARELVAMAVLSADGVDVPLIKVREHLEEIIADIQVLTRVNIAVTQLTSRLSHAQT